LNITNLVSSIKWSASVGRLPLLLRTHWVKDWRALGASTYPVELASVQGESVFDC